MDPRAGSAWRAPERPGLPQLGRARRRPGSFPHRPGSRPRAAEEPRRRSAGRPTITLRLTWACFASETQVLLGTRSFPWEESPVQPRALLRSTLGGSLGPAASRASFPAPRPRAQVSPHSSFPPARGSRACGSPEPGPALRSPALPPFPPGPAQPPPRRGSRPGLSVSLPPPPPLLPKSCYF